MDAPPNGHIICPGHKFGDWEVIDANRRNKSGRRVCLVRCACGLEKEICFYALKNGKTSRCVVCSNRRLNHDYKRTHGHTVNGRPSKIYSVWYSMIQRTTRPYHKEYHNYGGRGISVCERWHKFENFLEDMGEAPDGLTLDRIDNDKGYSPDNCRWSSMKEQSNNRRTNRCFYFRGQRLTVAQWAELWGVNKAVLGRYLYRHTIAEAYTWYVIFSRRKWRKNAESV